MITVVKINNINRVSHAGWRDINENKYYFRSRWEANYARYLQFAKEQLIISDWQYEPQTFWFESIKRGVRSYLPDFKVIRPDGTHYWIEVKGYLDAKSLTKIKRFRKYYSSEELKLITKEWFCKNSNKMKLIIKGWE